MIKTAKSLTVFIILAISSDSLNLVYFQEKKIAMTFTYIIAT